MGENTIERVARIIDPDAWAPVDQCASYVARHTIPKHRQREESLAKARKILAALREPSDAMMIAAANTPGMKAVSAVMELHQGRGYRFNESDFPDNMSPILQAWHAAIDTALTEGTEHDQG